MKEIVLEVFLFGVGGGRFFGTWQWKKRHSEQWGKTDKQEASEKPHYLLTVVKYFMGQAPEIE